MKTSMAAALNQMRATSALLEAKEPTASEAVEWFRSGEVNIGPRSKVAVDVLIRELEDARNILRGWINAAEGDGDAWERSIEWLLRNGSHEDQHAHMLKEEANKAGG